VIKASIGAEALVCASAIAPEKSKSAETTPTARRTEDTNAKYGVDADFRTSGYSAIHKRFPPAPVTTRTSDRLGSTRRHAQ